MFGMLPRPMMIIAKAVAQGRTKAIESGELGSVVDSDRQITGTIQQLAGQPDAQGAQLQDRF